MRQPLPRQRQRLGIGQCRVIDAGLLQHIAIGQEHQLRRHLESLLRIAQRGVQLQPLASRIVAAQLQRTLRAGHHVHAMRLLQARTQHAGTPTRFHAPLQRQLLGQPIQSVKIVVIAIEKLARRLVREWSRRNLLRIAIKALHQLLQLVLQVQLVLIQAHQHLRQARHRMHHAIQIGRCHVQVAGQPLVAEDAVQFAQQTPAAVFREIAQIHLEHLRQLQQHRGRHRPLVVLQLTDIAERQPQPFGKRRLRHLVLFTQPAQGRPHQQLAAHAGTPVFHNFYKIDPLSVKANTRTHERSRTW